MENSDEPYAEQIARKVMNEKKHGRPIETTTRLKEVIEEALSFLPEERKKRRERNPASAPSRHCVLILTVNLRYCMIFG